MSCVSEVEADAVHLGLCSVRDRQVLRSSGLHREGTQHVASCRAVLRGAGGGLEPSPIVMR